MSDTWDAGKHPRDDVGRFAHNWAKKLDEQIQAARGRGDFSSKPVIAQRGTPDRPRAARLGFVRVGDHPTRRGAVGGEDPRYFEASTHPDAGGVWVDPSRPGTAHAPRFLNDFGHGISDLRAVRHRTDRDREDRYARRREDLTHTPEGKERISQRDGGKIGRRYWDSPDEDSAALASIMTAALKRKKARARMERGGTDKWLLAANEQMERRRGA